MWFAFCCFLLVALDVTATTSTATTQRRLPRGTSSTDGLILNSTDVVEVQLSPGSTSLKFELCQKPNCKGTMLLWFSATGTDPSATRHKDGFCYFQHGFLSTNIKVFEGCKDGELSESKLRFHDGTGNNPCGIEISDDRRLKVQLESLVEGCEVRVTNGALWTGEDDRGSNLKVALAVGIPIGIIVVIGVILLIVFVGRPWWKKRKTKKNRAAATNASKDPAKRPSAAILPVQASACAPTPAASQASSVPPLSSVPPAPSVPAASSAAVTPVAPQAPSVPPAVSVPQTPAVPPSSAVPSSEPPAAQNEMPKAVPKKPTPVKVPRLQKDIMPSFDDLSPSEDNDPAKASKAASKETQQSVDGGNPRPGPKLSHETAAGSRRRSTDAREPSGVPQPEPVPPPHVRGNMEPSVYRQPAIPRAVDRDGNPRSEAVVAFEEDEVQ